MYNPYQSESFLITIISSRHLTDLVSTALAPGVYGQAPDYGAYPGAPPGMGEYLMDSFL